LRLLTAGLVLVIAGVHFQQYVDFMSRIPTVGVRFFGYAEPSLRLPILVAIVAELAVLPVAGLLAGQQPD
jgi:hypothetical protein